MQCIDEYIRIYTKRTCSFNLDSYIVYNSKNAYVVITVCVRCHLQLLKHSLYMPTETLSREASMCIFTTYFSGVVLSGLFPLSALNNTLINLKFCIIVCLIHQTGRMMIHIPSEKCFIHFTIPGIKWTTCIPMVGLSFALYTIEKVRQSYSQ